jgi:hypothetical protein
MVPLKLRKDKKKGRYPLTRTVTKKKKKDKKTKQLKEEWQVLHASQGLLNQKRKKEE